MLSVVGNIDPSQLTTELKFADGRILPLPTALLQATSLIEPVLQRNALESEGRTTVPIVPRRSSR